MIKIYSKQNIFLFSILILSFTFLLSQPQDAFGAIAFDNSDVTDGASDSCIVNVLNVEVDDVVVILIADSSDVSATPSISDENSHTWTQRRNDAITLAETYIFTTVITTTNTANDITVSWTGAGAFFCAGHVYSGVDTTTPVNQATGNALDGSATVSLNLTPPDAGQITVGVCSSEWNTTHTQTFDGTATGTERHELLRGGSDKSGISTIDMMSYTDTSQKDWTCNDGQSARDISASMIELNDASAGAPVYNIDLLDVYESSSTTLDSGTVVCTDVDTDTAQTCSGNLKRNSTYRFEVEVDNTGSGAGSPNKLEFRSSVASGDVLGSIVASAMLNSGCSTNIDWVESVSSTTAVADSGTTCSISASGTVEYWIIITIDPDAEADSMTFFISDGTVTDESTATSFTFDFTQNQQDTATGTDAKTHSTNNQLSDTASGTDDPKNDIAKAPIIDIATVTDNVTSSIVALIAEIATATSALAGFAINNREQDTAIITDDPKFSIVRDALTDIATATDSVSTSVEKTKTVSDVATATDDTTFDMTRSALIESATATDDVKNNISITISDTATATDSAVPSLSKMVTDTATATDAQDFAVNNQITDTAIGTDDVSHDITITISDTATATDSVTSTLDKFVTVSDIATATDAETESTNNQLSDTATATDAQDFAVNNQVTDTATATDSVTTTIDKFQTVTDSATASDAKNFDVTNEITDTAIATDNTTNNVNLTVSDTATATDTVTPVCGTCGGDNFEKLLTDTTTVTDRVQSDRIDLSDTATATDYVTTQYTTAQTETGTGGSPSTGGQPTQPEHSLESLQLFDVRHEVNPHLFGLKGEWEFIWDENQPIIVKDIDLGEYQSWFQFEETPIILQPKILSDDRVQAVIPYTIVTPVNICDPENGITQNCIEQKLYEIPVRYKLDYFDREWSRTSFVMLDVEKATQTELITMPLLIVGSVVVAGGVGATIAVSKSSKSQTRKNNKIKSKIKNKKLGQKQKSNKGKLQQQVKGRDKKRLEEIQKSREKLRQRLQNKNRNENSKRLEQMRKDINERQEKLRQNRQKLQDNLNKKLKRR